MELRTTTKPGQLCLTASDTPPGLVLVEIQGSQSQIDRYGLAPPRGFEEDRFGDRLPGEDTAALAEAENYNVGQFRWTGELPLDDGHAVVFPIRAPLDQPVVLTLTWRYRALGLWRRQGSEYVRFIPDHD